MSEAIGQAVLGVATLGTSELLPKGLKKPLTRGIGAGLTLGTSELLRKPGQPGSPGSITTQDKAVQEIAADARLRRSRARGASSTILGGFLNQALPGAGSGMKTTTGS